MVGREETKEVDGESFIGVEGTIVGTDEGTVEFWPFGKRFTVRVVRVGHDDAGFCCCCCGLEELSG